MRIYIGGRASKPVVLAGGAILLLFALLPNVGQAANLKDLQGLQNNIGKEVNRSRGLTRAILTKFKEIDLSCRTAEGRPVPGQMTAARHLLGQTQVLRSSFAATAKNAEDLITEFSGKYRAIKNPGARENASRTAVDRLSADLRKYKNYVQKFFGQAERDFGMPIEPSARDATVRQVPVQTAPGLRIKGEVNGILGGSSYKRPHADPTTDLSSSNIGLRVAGSLTPNARTQIPFQLSHENKIEQKKIGLTKLGTGIRHALNEKVDLKFNLGYHGFSDKDADALSFGDLSLGAGSSYHTDRLQFNVNVRRLSRSYGDNETANYSTLDLQPDLALRAGKGRTTFGIKFFSKSNEVKFLDHKEFSPFFRWEFSPGGSELNVRYQQMTHPNVDDSPQDNNRLKASLFSKKTSAAGKTMYGPEIAVYLYPNAEQNDYMDLGFVWNGHSFGRKTAMTNLRLVYRMYDDTLRFDFAQFTFRKNKRPAGSGFGWELNLAGRFYTEASDKDNPLRFSNVHDPHTLDYYQHLGWTKTGTGSLREVSFGPVFGGKFYIDTERDDAFENDIDYVWANPRNTVLGGIHGKMRLMATPVLRIRTAIQWRTDFLYNAAPTRRYSIIDLDLAADYQINSRLLFEAKVKIHMTRADIESDTDLEKSNVTVRLRYLFDVVR